MAQQIDVLFLSLKKFFLNLFTKELRRTDILDNKRLRKVGTQRNDHKINLTVAKWVKFLCTESRLMNQIFAYNLTRKIYEIYVKRKTFGKTWLNCLESD